MAWVKLGGRPEKVCGYCMFHRTTLTVSQLREKECLKKHCTALIRREEHPYWAQREESRAKRKARKERLNKRWENIRTQ